MTIYNWKQCFGPERLTEELQTSSFSVEEIYSDVCGTPFDLDRRNSLSWLGSSDG